MIAPSAGHESAAHSRRAVVFFYGASAAAFSQAIERRRPESLEGDGAFQKTVSPSLQGSARGSRRRPPARALPLIQSDTKAFVR
ncbi:hypothetical protein MTO96_013959 [Rhipicephalus appendiculatus]